jgi:two-component system, OmpR family, phosphate regulon sensor histidine kinase PhoR
MRLPGRTVSIITLAVVISLLGLVILQASLLKSAAAQKEQAFRQNVSAALNAVAQKLEVGEAATSALGVYSCPSVLLPDSVLCKEVIANINDSLAFGIQGSPIGDSSTSRFFSVSGDTLSYKIVSPQKVAIKMLPRDSSSAITLVDTFRNPGMYRVRLPENIKVGAFECKMGSDSMTIPDLSVLGHKTVAVADGLNKVTLVMRVVSNLTEVESEPIEERVKQSHLDSLIGTSLKEAHIELPYVFGVVRGASDSLRITNGLQFANQLKVTDFRTGLFPSDIFATPAELLLYFPSYKSYIRQQVQLLLFLTIVFMAVIVFCFAFILRTIHKQRRFADRTVEFINNMTHEFKTPLSTVSLACDALLRPNRDRESPDVSRYGRMIKDENLRMQNQVEKILQMAVLEDREYDLTLTDVDAHEIIQRAVASMTVCAEERGGRITCELNASRYVLLADAVHLANIIHNLLENACKYSSDKPFVTVSTEDCSGGITISVKDQGIGIPERDRKMVFEKYYRVPSGNVQNVRGFGIGLSYVKLMTEAMGGMVDLESEEGKGTVVHLTFPASS